MNKHDKIFGPRDFFTHVNEDKKLYLTLVDPQLVFFNAHGVKEMIA